MISKRGVYKHQRASVIEVLQCIFEIVIIGFFVHVRMSEGFWDRWLSAELHSCVGKPSQLILLLKKLPIAICHWKPGGVCLDAPDNRNSAVLHPGASCVHADIGKAVVSKGYRFEACPVHHLAPACFALLVVFHLAWYCSENPASRCVE